MRLLITITLFLLSLTLFSQTYVGVCTSNLEWHEGDNEMIESKEWLGNKVEFYISSVTKSITVSQIIGKSKNIWYSFSINRDSEDLYYLDETNEYKIYEFKEYNKISTNKGKLHIYKDKIELVYHLEYGKNSIRTFEIH